ncbi:MAG: CHASE2 domain-containing protein [Verrucomicrobiota bacterium]
MSRHRTDAGRHPLDGMLSARSNPMPRRRIVVILLLAALCGTVAALLEFIRPSYFRQSESFVRDAMMRRGRTTPPNADLIFLAIDNASITLDPTLDLEGLFSSASTAPESRKALELMSKGWPWNREVYALILDRLIAAGAKVVALDCFFAEPGPGDDAFRAALDRFRDHVVIGSNFVTSADVDLTRPLPSRYDLPAGSVVAHTALADNRIGFTNFFADEGRIVRAAQYRVAFREGGPPATYLSLSARTAEKAGAAAKIPDDFAEHLIRFTGPPGVGFRPHPIYEIFVPEYWKQNYRSGELFRDKIVIIGAEGSWQKDSLMTPFGWMPGAELHLNALNALMRENFVKELPMPAAIATIIFFLAIATAINLGFQSSWVRLALLGVGSTGAILSIFYLYNTWSVFVPATAPLLALNATVLLGFASDFAFERLEKLGLRSTLKTRDDLTHMIVHDLRSPLGLVTGYVGVLQQIAATKLNPSELECLSGAMHGADDIRDMISTLLDLERLESGQMPLRLESVDIGDLTNKVVSRFGPVLAQRKLSCDLPPQPLFVTCDTDVVRRVIANLLTNAVKFTKGDGNILVGVGSHGANAIVSVTDDGAGIPAAEHQHVFEKFGQAKGGDQHRHSSGIGLAFCRMAVEAHGGKIGVASEVGRGSIFSFALPISVTTPTPARPDPIPA